MRLNRTVVMSGLAAATLVLSSCTAHHQATGVETYATPELTRAHALLATTPLIDGHNDLPWAYRSRFENHLAQMDIADDLTQTLDRPTHTDIPRLRRGGLGAQFWSVYIPIREYPGKPGDMKTVSEQIDVVHRLCELYPDDLEIALTADDIERIFNSGKVASLIGMEGGHSIENSLAALRMTYKLGARYMTITHSLSTEWADSATDIPRHNGLTPFGEEVIREMNRLGMLVDLSHVSPDTMHDALDIAESPVIFSHSSARAITDHPRNVPDDVLHRVRDNNGIVMVTFVPTYISQPLRTWDIAHDAERDRLRELHGEDQDSIDAAMQAWLDANPKPRATLNDVADHIDHIANTAGHDHVGIGGDFDGVSSLPDGLHDVTTYPDLIAELFRRGWTDADVRKLLGENLLRVLRANEQTAARLQRNRPASDKLIADTNDTGS